MKHILIILLFLTSCISDAAELIVLDPLYRHDHWITKPRDVMKEFRAFTVSIDSLDNDGNLGKSKAFGTPEWVAYQIKSYSRSCIPTKPRPAEEFVEGKIAPTDTSHRYS